MNEYFENLHEAIKEFDKYNRKNAMIKPMYILIKVDVDADIVRSNTDANFYCENHCNSLQYALVDFYYPDTEEYPYIAK